MRNNRIVTAGAWAAACVLAALGCSSCGSSEGSRPDVVFILLDALRPDHLGIYGYGGGTSPRLDGLAREGAVFRNHFANGTYTRASVPTYFYSRYYIKSLFPADRRLPLESPENLFRVLDPQALSLAALFKANGYHTVLFSAHPWFIRGHELVGDFDEFYRISGAKSAHGEADEVVKRVEEWIAAHGEEDRPYFLYVHMMDTHFPHVRRAETDRFLEGVDSGEPERFDWRGYFLGQEMGKWGLWWLPPDFGPEDRRYLHALYDGDVAFSDFWVGHLVDFLRARGREDSTLFLITADHGEHLGEHGLTEHGGPPWDSVLRVPLILRYPAKVPAGTEVKRITEMVDVLPTLTGLLDLKVPPGKRFDGKDAFAAGPGADYALGRDFIRDDRYKYFTDPDGAPHLYDLARDPGEETNLAAELPGEAGRWAALKDKLLFVSRRRFEASVTTSPPDLPFAVSADFFTLSSVSRVWEISRYGYPSPEGEIAAEADSEPVWIHNRIAGRYYVLARNRDLLRPLLVSFAVPDGDYRVGMGVLTAADFRGGALTRCRVAVGSDDPAAAVPVDPANEADGLADLGRCRIAGGTFRAFVYPEPAPDWTSILYFGFEPIGGSKRDSASEGADGESSADRVDKIKTLGYM